MSTVLLNLMHYEVYVLVLILLLLLMKVFSSSANSIAYTVEVLLALGLLSFFLPLQDGELFGAMFVQTPLLRLEKWILLAGTCLVSIQARPWLKNHKAAAEFYMLLLSALLGMFLMISSRHALMFYLGLEMATIPLAALVAFDFHQARSAEAGAKMILMSAFASAILLFGLSFLYGATGEMTFSGISRAFSGSPMELFAFACIFAGFAFKISIVPFHFWTADVYEGAPIAVTTFLSVLSKAAALFIFTNVLYLAFPSIRPVWTVVLVCLSVVTMLVGNLFAMRQTNIKRFLAFSSITQAGFIFIAIASGTASSMASVVYFMLVYLCSNLAAFTVVSIVSENSGKESMDDYAGFYKNNPKLALVLMMSLFSLAGVPPTAGFFGKLFLLTSGAGAGLLSLIIVAAVNMVIALYYYLRWVRVMFSEPNEQAIASITSDWSSRIVMIAGILGILFTGFAGFVFDYIQSLSFGI